MLCGFYAGIKTASFVSGDEQDHVHRKTHPRSPYAACCTRRSRFDVAHERLVLGLPKGKPQRDCCMCPATFPPNRCPWAHSLRGCSMCPATNRCPWAHSLRGCSMCPATNRCPWAHSLRGCSMCPATNRCPWAHSLRGCSMCPATNGCSWAESKRLQ